MTQKILLVGAAIAFPILWLVGASYAFVFLVGMHQWWDGSASITDFHGRISSAGYHPWLAYWTYSGSAKDTIDKEIFFWAAWIPFIFPAALVALALSDRNQGRTGRRLTRLPWQRETISRP